MDRTPAVVAAGDDDLLGRDARLDQHLVRDSSAQEYELMASGSYRNSNRETIERSARKFISETSPSSPRASSPSASAEGEGRDDDGYPRTLEVSRLDRVFDEQVHVAVHGRVGDRVNFGRARVAEDVRRGEAGRRALQKDAAWSMPVSDNEI